MPTTHEQKADIGSRYVEAIKKRITTRSAFQDRLSKEVSALELYPAKGFGHELLRDIAKGVAKKHKFHAIGAKLGEVHRPGPNKKVLKIYGKDHAMLRVSMPAELVRLEKEKERLIEKKREVCSELEFLNGHLAPWNVSKFQSHAARMWAPGSKSDYLPESLLKSLLEDFLQGKRPVVCAL